MDKKQRPQTLNPDLERMVKETHDTVIKIETVLMGVPDSAEKGLCGQVAELSESHAQLKRLVYTVIGVLIGSGILGGATAAIIEVMKK